MTGHKEAEMIRVLIIDHEKDKLDRLEHYLKGINLQVSVALGLQKGKTMLKKLKFALDMVISDIKFKHEDSGDREGLDLLSYIKRNYPSLPVIMMSAFAAEEFDLVTESMRLGAATVVDMRPGKAPLQTLKKKIQSVAAETGAHARKLVLDTSRAYNAYPEDYEKYADGNVKENLYDYEDRIHGFADKTTTEKIEQIVTKCLSKRKGPLKILDFGCGSGTWLRRIMDKFVVSKGARIECVGVDISDALLSLAERRLEEYNRKMGTKINIQFRWADLSESLPFGDNEFDITLCLYTVLNHIPVSNVQTAVQEMLRVTKEVNVTSIKPAGGMPTVYVCNIEDIVKYEQSFETLTFLHRNGEQWTICSHLFTREEIIDIFSEFSRVEECLGLGIFSPRLKSPNTWRTKSGEASFKAVREELEELEKSFCSKPQWIDMANHIMVISRSTDAS